MDSEALYVAAYSIDERLLYLQKVECDGNTSYTANVPVDSNINYAKIFVWNSPSSLQPLAGVEIVDMTK